MAMLHASCCKHEHQVKDLIEPLAWKCVVSRPGLFGLEFSNLKHGMNKECTLAQNQNMLLSIAKSPL